MNVSTTKSEYSYIDVENNCVVNFLFLTTFLQILENG